MSENPYQSPSTAGSSSRQGSARRVVWSGIVCLGLAGVCLGLAGVCLVLTVVGLMAAFRAVAESTTPVPDELASRISYALLPSFAGVLLGIVGIGLLILGFVKRRPAK